MILRPTSVALYGRVAVLTGPGADRHKGAVYALRISDGRIAELGIGLLPDRPIIGPAGVAYQIDPYLKAAHHTPRATR